MTVSEASANNQWSRWLSVIVCVALLGDVTAFPVAGYLSFVVTHSWILNQTFTELKDIHFTPKACM